MDRPPDMALSSPCPLRHRMLNYRQVPAPNPISTPVGVSYPKYDPYVGLVSDKIKVGSLG